MTGRSPREDSLYAIDIDQFVRENYSGRALDASEVVINDIRKGQVDLYAEWVAKPESDEK